MQKLITLSKITATIDGLRQSKALQKLGQIALWIYVRLPEVVVYGYAFLYMYTGYDKLVNAEAFIKGNSKIPLVGQYAGLIGWGIPILEILLAILLIIPIVKVKKITLWPSVGLMAIFTIYLVTMLMFVPDRLCHCGGVIESMSWTSHLIFNLIWLGAGIFAIKKLKKLYF